MRKTYTTTTLFLLTFISFLQADGQAVTGDITGVIVYRGQALVTRAIEIDKPAGDLELIVENLPERILSESLYAQADGGIQVLSVRYREKTTREDKREEVKKLEAEIHALRRQIRDVHRNLERSNDCWAAYRSLWNLSADTVKSDLNRAVLQSSALIELTEFLESKHKEIHEQNILLENQKLDLEEQIAELNKKLENLSKGHQTIHREAVVYLHKPSDKPAQLDLSYLVTNAGWSPQYNLWARPSDSKVRMEYLAVVHQASGEDWTSASLALSTAEPTLVASPPILEPMEVTLQPGRGGYWDRLLARNMPAVQSAEPVQTMGVSYIDQSQAFEGLNAGRRAVIAKGILAQAELNEIAIGNQMIELEADKRLLAEIKQKSAAIARSEGVSVMYALPGKLTLPSRSDQQLVTIASEDLPAVYTLLASPLLTDYVYLWAQATNSSDTILLPGPSSTYRNGEFVGKGQMPLVTIGQSFDSGFGIDSQVQVVREFKDKKIETLWGNRMDQQQYTLSISNYKNQPVRLRLIERIPWTENEQIEITLNETSHPLSTDPEYVQKQKDRGILRWDLDLSPNTSGTKATVVTYSYTMKYDGAMHIQPVAKAQP